MNSYDTLHEGTFHWNLSLANGEFAKIEISLLSDISNLSMTVNRNLLQKLEWPILNSVNLTNLSHGANFYLDCISFL